MISFQTALTTRCTIAAFIGLLSIASHAETDQLFMQHLHSELCGSQGQLTKCFKVSKNTCEKEVTKASNSCLKSKKTSINKLVDENNTGNLQAFGACIGETFAKNNMATYQKDDPECQ